MLSYYTNNMQKLYCYIDESGTLPDPNDKIIIMAAIGTSLPQSLIEINKQVRKQMKSRKKSKNISEIKFYHAGDKTRKNYLKRLSDSNIDIFALIVDKQGQSIPDNPENYAVLCYILLEECQIFYKNALKEVIFDKHFHKPSDRKLFDNTLSNLLKYKTSFLHVDSSKDIAVNASDMVAGSLLWKYSGKNDEFYNLIKNKIITETVIYWKEAKRKFIERKK